MLVSVQVFYISCISSQSNLQTRNNPHNDDIIQVYMKPNQIKVADVVRGNVALFKQTYQSSVVDNLISDNAITPPYDRGSHTRLEADPWWEVDLGKLMNLYSVTFDPVRKKSQSTSIFVLLLDHPVGFENPFLDDLRASCIACKEFVLPRASSSDEEVTWILPEISTRVRSVRIQIRGVSSLYLMSFKAAQGDAVEEEEDQHTAGSELQAIGGDVVDDGSLSAITLGTFAAIPLSSIKSELRKCRRWNDKGDPRRPKTSTEMAAAASASHAAAMKAVEEQLRRVQAQYDMQSKWRLRATQACDYFDNAQLRQAYLLVGPRATPPTGQQPPSTPQSTLFLTQLQSQPEAASPGGSLASSTPSTGVGVSKLLVTLRDLIFNTAVDVLTTTSQLAIRSQDIRTSALMQNEPRCSLASMFHRLRLVLNWINSKQHTKEVEILSRYEAFHSICFPINTLENCLCNLAQVFLYLDTGRIEPPAVALEHYDKGTQQKRKDSAFSLNSGNLSLSKPSLLSAVMAHTKLSHAHQNNVDDNAGDANLNPNATLKKRSVSWSQFAVIMELVCSHRIGRIIQEAFLEDPTPFVSQLNANDPNYKTALSGPLFASKQKEATKKRSPLRVGFDAAPRGTLSSRRRGRNMSPGASGDSPISFTQTAPAGLQYSDAALGLSLQLSTLSSPSQTSPGEPSAATRYKRGLVLMRPMTSKECRERMCSIMQRLDLPDPRHQAALEAKCAHQLGSTRKGLSLARPDSADFDALSSPDVLKDTDHKQLDEAGDTFLEMPSMSSKQFPRTLTRLISSNVSDSGTNRLGMSSPPDSDPRSPDTRSRSRTRNFGSVSADQWNGRYSPSFEQLPISTNSLALHTDSSPDNSPSTSPSPKKDPALKTLPAAGSPTPLDGPSDASWSTCAFLKRCLLCERKFPSNVLDSKVMYKHVEALRRGLQAAAAAEEGGSVPDLLDHSRKPSQTALPPILLESSEKTTMSLKSTEKSSKRIFAGPIIETSSTSLIVSGGGLPVGDKGAIGADPQPSADNAGESSNSAANMSAYRTVAVCRLCSQFFDPDYPGGISFPSKQSLEEHEREMAANDGHHLQEFFDHRYVPLRAWTLASDAQARRSRSGARKAVEVHRSINL